MNHTICPFEFCIERDTDTRVIARSFIYLEMKLSLGWEVKYNYGLN